jgi:hypothetical protein
LITKPTPRDQTRLLTVGTLLAGLLALPGSAAAAGTQVVDSVTFGGDVNMPSPSLNTGGWTVYSEFSPSPNNGYAFVTGPTGQPLGVGSIKLNNGPDVGKAGSKVYLESPKLPLTALSAIDALSYHTRQASSEATVYVNIPIEPLSIPADPTTTFATLNYAPDLAPADAIKPNTWESFDARDDTTKRWYLSRKVGIPAQTVDGVKNVTNIGGSDKDSPVGTQGHPLTFSQISGALPNARITTAGVQFVVGQSTASETFTNFTGYVDAVTIGVSGTETIYDFEPPTASKPAPGASGANGAPGTQGSAGSAGSAGTAGKAGAAGTPGSPGTQGASGEAGSGSAVGATRRQATHRAARRHNSHKRRHNTRHRKTHHRKG